MVDKRTRNPDEAPRDERAADRLLDVELEQSFPASDPLPSWTHDAKPHELYLEDLAVGQTYSTHALVLNEDEMRAFAAQFDPQPFHLDEAAARASIFGGLAASGWHTAALTMRLLVDGFSIAGGLVGLGGEIAWPRPTFAGDSIHVEIEILEIVPSRTKPIGIVTMRQRTLNQHGKEVQIATVKIRVPRRGG